MEAHPHMPGIPFDRIAAVEARLSGVEATITQINIRLESIDRRLGSLEARLWWILSLQVATVIAILVRH